MILYDENRRERRGCLHCGVCYTLSFAYWYASQSTHRAAIAAFWRTFHHDGKISPGWCGWGSTPTRCCEEISRIFLIKVDGLHTSPYLYFHTLFLFFFQKISFLSLANSDLFKFFSLSCTYRNDTSPWVLRVLNDSSMTRLFRSRMIWPHRLFPPFPSVSSTGDTQVLVD